MVDARNHIIIIGTGFSGLGMAIRLKRAGIHTLTVLERAGSVGGTWRDNHYPGAACDIPSHLYSFSFEPQPQWTRAYAEQWQILEYLKHCTDKYGVRPHIRFNAEVHKAVFDEDAGVWHVETTDGRTFAGGVLVSGCGGLSRPKLPTIAGIDDFEGATFHSASWNHDFDLAGKSVGVVGTGASAIQFVPQIAPTVDKLTLFQRTPPWIVPKPDRPITDREHRLFERAPLVQKLFRWGQWARAESLALGFIVDQRINKFAQRIALRHIESQVSDARLRSKLIPNYTLGCKRVLISNDYYPALTRENVELVTDGIERIEAKGVRTRDGALREFDAIIFGTGFNASEDMAPFPVIGRGGRQLAQQWQAGAEAHLGTTVTGFPNFFLIVGPNTGLGHNSMIYMIESQIQYVFDAIQTLRKRGLKFIDVRADAQADFNLRLHRRLGKTVWSSGCNSWYQNSEGKNVTLWPGFTFEFRLRTRRLRLRDYELCAAAP